MHNHHIKSAIQSGMGALALIVALSACATTAQKTRDVGEVTPEVSASEQLATALNAKAAANAQKAGGYRDPQVRSVNGPSHEISQQQGSTGFYPAAPTAPAGPAAAGQTGIAGLITQPTSLNANRSSIFSTPTYAVRADGTLAGPAGSAQGTAQAFRNVYSAPTLTERAPQQAGMMPGQETPRAAVPPAPPQAGVAMARPSSSRPTADATPSRILPAPGNAHKLDSQEALMVARSLASKQSQGGTMTLPPGSATAMVKQNDDMALTPGMAASLK